MAGLNTVGTRTDTRAVDLDPSLVAEHLYATRRRRHVVDLTAALNLVILLLFLVPAWLVLPQLSSVGRPALMLGLLLTSVWVVTKLHPRLVMRGPQPMRWAVALWLAALLTSYTAGQLRGLTELEANSADRAMILYCSLIGLVLLCADGIPSRRRLDELVQVLVGAASVVAVIGLLQSITGFDVTQYIQIPGLVHHGEMIGFEARGGFQRVASTTLHYIEFSALMAVALPFAIHTARFAATPLVRQLATMGAVLIAVSLPLSISRTGILALVVGVLAMLPVWSWRLRFNMGVAALVLAAMAMFLRPGFLGTLVGLFSNLSDDASVEGRTSRYDTVYAYVVESPLIGRGTGTFLPEMYILLDNHWLAALVETGLLGVVVLAGVHVTAIVLAVKVRRRAATEEDRQDRKSVV